MSMQHYETRGFGIEFRNNDGEKTTVEKIKQMLEQTPLLKKEIEEWFLEIDVENPTLDDYTEFEQDKYCGIPALMAMAINEKYDTDFVEFDSDENGAVFVYIPCLMPWQMSDFEKTLTEEKATEILKEFYNILYEKETNISNVSIYQFG